MILSFINIRKVPREVLKTSGFALGFQHLARGFQHLPRDLANALGFQHLPRDLANVNEWKIMFDPYSDAQSDSPCIPESFTCKAGVYIHINY